MVAHKVLVYNAQVQVHRPPRVAAQSLGLRSSSSSSSSSSQVQVHKTRAARPHLGQRILHLIFIPLHSTPPPSHVLSGAVGALSSSGRRGEGSRRGGRGEEVRLTHAPSGAPPLGPSVEIGSLSLLLCLWFGALGDLFPVSFLRSGAGVYNPPRPTTYQGRLGLRTFPLRVDGEVGRRRPWSRRTVSWGRTCRSAVVSAMVGRGVRSLDACVARRWFRPWSGGVGILK